MKNNITLFLLILCVQLYAQQADVFGIARTGTVEQALEAVKSNPNAFDTADARGITPLILACYRGNNEVAKYIIDSGVNIDANSEMGTALMASIVKGNREIAELLLSKNANPDLTDRNGTTALIYAVQFKNKEVIKSLLRHKADKSLIDKNGKTAFEHAAFAGDDEIINLLK